MTPGAFFNEPNLKAALLTQLHDHARMDDFLQGTYGEDCDGRVKGCFLYCTTHDQDAPHASFAKYYHLPLWLSYLAEYFFENLNADEAKKLAIPLIESIPVGADLTGVYPRFAYALVMDREHGVIQYTKDRPQAYDAVMGVAKLFEAGQWPERQSAEAAAAAAWAIEAAAAARAAAAAAWAARAARAAAEAAARAAAAAAWAARAARAAAGAARAAATRWQRDLLFSLLAEAPVIGQTTTPIAAREGSSVSSRSVLV